MSLGMIGGCCGPCWGGFNGTVNKIHVWRGDGWDWGGPAPPTAFFVVGEFTEYQSRPAGRIAKFRKGNNSRPLFDTGFAAKNSFTGVMHFCSTSKGAAVKLMVGTLGASRTGAVVNTPVDPARAKIAWLIDAVSGDVTYSAPDIGYTYVAYISCINGLLGVTEFSRMHSLSLNGGATVTKMSEDNLHNNLGLLNGWFVTGRPVKWTGTGITTPYGMRYVNGAMNLIGPYGGKSGSDISMFTMAGFPLTARHELVWTSATKEFARAPALWSWNGIQYFNLTASPELANVNAALFVVNTNGNQDNTGAIGVEYGGLRPQPLCVDTLGRLWFTGGVNKVWTRQGRGVWKATNTSPWTLYRFEGGRGEVVEMGVFSGGVPIDCQYFGVGLTQGHQFIVAGSFTGYSSPGKPGTVHRADRLLYINENGLRLESLEWP